MQTITGAIVRRVALLGLVVTAITAFVSAIILAWASGWAMVHAGRLLPFAIGLGMVLLELATGLMVAKRIRRSFAPPTSRWTLAALVLSVVALAVNLGLYLATAYFGA